MTHPTPDTSSLPLIGLHVVELHAIGPVPFAAQVLRSLGATVTRVSPPNDPGLGVPMPKKHDLLNAGKAVTLIDLKSVEGRAQLMALLAKAAPCDAIAAVPYGWTTNETVPGQFRLGDQAAVIPSLAGEGNGIALASGMMAAAAWLDGESAAAPAFQRALAKRTRRPVRTAKTLWRLGEHPLPAALATRVLSIAPGLAGFLARMTRIRD